VWDRLPDAGWNRVGEPLRGGPQPMAASVTSRVREVAVHHVDLGLGFGPADLPAGFVARERGWLADARPAGTWPGAVW
jgi:maleylpyruvate isomerase